MTYVLYMVSPIGPLKITCDEQAILSIEHNETGQNSSVLPSVLLQCKTQLEQYFAGERTQLDVPVSFKGTVFQQQVWHALQQIPYGEVRSYKQIAEAIGNPKAVRAVGNANNKNKIPFLVPCHRVVGANGALVGYALGLEHKKYLLELEKKALCNNE